MRNKGNGVLPRQIRAKLSQKAIYAKCVLSDRSSRAWIPDIDRRKALCNQGLLHFRKRVPRPPKPMQQHDKMSISGHGVRPRIAEFG
jgi:hypothetical protein